MDARNLVPQPSGIARVVLEASRHLSMLGCDVKLYLPSPPHKSIQIPGGLNLDVGHFYGSLARGFWGQTVLPATAARDKLDVFWGPAHRLPAQLPRTLPRVVTIHDLVWIHSAATMRRRTWLGERIFMDSAVHAADIVVADSNATARDIEKRYVGLRGPVVTAYPGATAIDVDAGSTIRERHSLSRPYALFVGTLEPRKNLPQLLRAYALQPPAVRATCMLAIIGGSGWRSSGLPTIITELGLSEDVKLIGYVSEGDLGFLYANARFLVMPSLYEGFGLPIVESNALGVPALVSDRSCLPEIGGAAALCVDARNEIALAEGFRTLAVDDALHDRLASRARANADRFQWHKFAETMVEVFERAITMRNQM
ncbi:glycosyltransferase family 4 protein [Aurantimonas manganoxydans]|uniref:glycosyltransferase family 4 protein n=1 Tax=Aurantimonas manganoxydans TaxID=651183 RepID=UPI0011D18DBA